MSLNKIGIIGVILALIGLLLPWWEMDLSAWETTNGKTITTSASISVYLYQISSKNFPSQTITIDEIPFISLVLPLVLISIGLGIAGCLVDDEKKEEALLILAGSLMILSTVVFVFILQVELLASPPASFFLFFHPERATIFTLVPVPKVGIFSNGMSTFEGISMDYSSYLYVGFWLTITAAIVLLIASRRESIYRRIMEISY